METESGNQAGLAIRAVLGMQADCVRLFRDLDRALDPLQPISGNNVTAGNSTSINAAQLYLPKLLFRRYARHEAEHLVLGICIWLHNHPSTQPEEPIFIAGKVEYTQEALAYNDAPERAWDPLAAFWDWNSERKFGQVFAFTQPQQRSTVKSITVAAEPLYSIRSLDEALRVIDMVGRP